MMPLFRGRMCGNPTPHWDIFVNSKRSFRCGDRIVVPVNNVQRLTSLATQMPISCLPSLLRSLCSMRCTDLSLVVHKPPSKFPPPLGPLLDSLALVYFRIFWGVKREAIASSVANRKMYGAELIVMITATFSLAIAGAAPAVNIIAVTIFWRGILGIGTPTSDEKILTLRYWRRLSHSFHYHERISPGKMARRNDGSCIWEPGLGTTHRCSGLVHLRRTI